LLSVSAFAADIETQVQFLSGKGKDDAVPWDFRCTSGRRSNEWSKMPVPGCWELHGFGSYAYGNARKENNEQGKYRYAFTVPDSWRGKIVHLVFDGVMTDAEVSLNGKPAGTKHSGAFYRFQHDVTKLLKLGQPNLLEVLVSKISTNASVNEAERQGDYWNFGGIFRPVWLEALPQKFIERVAIDARADGAFAAQVFLGGKISGDEIVSAQLLSPDKKLLGESFRTNVADGATSVVLQTKASGQRNWTAETPRLYKVQITLKRGETELHQVTERFGFRTVEVKPGEGLFVNGQRVRLKGCNRHSFWPESGRTTSEKISRDDVRLLKEMNMNAVRMSHYPPDEHFLAACDEAGLYVLDELGGWQKKYDAEIGRELVGAMVQRDVNHPSIIFWDNGNEGGWNTELDGEFAKHDPQQRTVLHPWAAFRGINAAHYLTYSNTLAACAGPDLFMPTEFLHGLYDGGTGAGLQDYWDAMRNSTNCIGGFIWAFLDEGVVRTDKGNRIDCAGNWAPDGIVGPRREKEGSFYSIRDLWSPIQASIKTNTTEFIVALENRYDFTNLKDCRFQWRLVMFPTPSDLSARRVVNTGRLIGPDAKPGETATMRLPLPGDWQQCDAVTLEAFAPDGQSVWIWRWPIRSQRDLAALPTTAAKNPVAIKETGGKLVVATGAMRFTFDANDARLLGVANGKQNFSFGNGPRLVFTGALEKSGPFNPYYTTVTHKMEGDACVVELKRGGGFESLRWRVEPNGALELKYRFPMKGAFDYFGVTFDFPEPLVRAKRWLGQGPYRVYKNRLAGTELDTFEVAHNDPLPGASWKYPEFKGYFAGLHWLRLITEQGPITIATPTENLFCRLYTPKLGDDDGSVESRRLAVPYPDGDISFLHAIPPIGNKFATPDQTGPQGQPTRAAGKYDATLYFQFGEMK
jgi:hypothetical protein